MPAALIRAAMGESAKEMGFLTHWPLILLLVIVLIIVGPGKLPQIGGAIGGAIREFRRSTSDIKDQVTGAVSPVEQAAKPVEPKKDAPDGPKA